MEAKVINRAMINVDPEDWEQIRREAFRRSISRSELLRRIVRSYIRGEGIEEPGAGPARKSIRKPNASIP